MSWSGEEEEEEDDDEDDDDYEEEEEMLHSMSYWLRNFRYFRRPMFEEFIDINSPRLNFGFISMSKIHIFFYKKTTVHFQAK